MHCAALLHPLEWHAPCQSVDRNRMCATNDGTNTRAAANSPAKVAILMCTYNGEAFLQEQLDSLNRQEHSCWELHISDDGSVDDTHEILRAFQARHPERVFIYSGPRQGFAQNFLSLTCRPTINADLFAYSDQDDIWDHDKLARALQWHRSVSAQVPALYCGRTRLIDEEGRSIGLSPLFSRKPSFRNALVQSIAGANTMVFNQALRQKIQRRSQAKQVVSHDWWLYMLASGCGGEVYYDANPSIGYRQHSTNLVGANTSIKARLTRIMASFGGRFTEWNDKNIAALRKCTADLSEENRNTFEDFVRIRQSALPYRVYGVLKTGLYRQTLAGNCSLIAAALLGKM